ncbi:MAG: MBL fold metallo-hydrolase [Anaerolineales bacterium]|jgi:metallo-beta-lactamase family protein|nr:MBL fold metallo-hydrolase [Anaerolineales bacterium]
MKISFHGAAQTVTGSQHLLEINGYKLLLECGLYQGKRRDTYDRNRNFNYTPSAIDAVILSHAHIDHSGNLPNLVKNGYHGPIYTTPASAHLANIMLMDSAHVQEQDVKYLNRKKLKRGEPFAEPLYTQENAAQVAQYFVPTDYNRSFEPVPGVQVHFVDAGHILGSAAVVLDIEEKGRKFRLWFSGDIGRRNLPLLRDPVLPEGADYLIMESTYGDKPHREPELAYDELRQVVNRTIQRGGKVIVPAFAVGRTQELVYDLHQMIEKREIPSIPVIVDSPLAVNATEVFKAHPECFDEETQAFIKNDRHKTVFGFDRLTYTRSVEDSKALNDRTEPMVIISASGMAETGRILHHLKNNVEDPKNTVMIVSWQSPETLGRRIADREPRIKIFDDIYELRAEVATIGGLSAHAGQNLLLEYAQAVRGTVKGVYLVHGEPKSAEMLRGLLKERGMRQVHYPGLHDSVEIS